MAGDALSRGQIVMGAGIGALVLAGVVVASFSAGGSGARPTCVLRVGDTVGGEVPLFQTPAEAAKAYTDGTLGRPMALAGAAWVPGETVATVLGASGVAVQVGTPKASGWVASAFCHR